MGEGEGVAGRGGGEESSGGVGKEEGPYRKTSGCRRQLSPLTAESGGLRLYRDGWQRRRR